MLVIIQHILLRNRITTEDLSFNRWLSISSSPSDPMRITKKFAGSSCIGKQVCVAGDGVIDEKKMIQIQEELKSLEETFISKVEQLHKLSHRHSVNPLLARVSMDGGHHRIHHPTHPNQVAGYPTLYYPCQKQHPPPHRGNALPQSLLATHGPSSHNVPDDAYSYTCYPDNRNGGYHSEAPSFDANNFTLNPQLLLRRLQHHHHVPKCNPPTPVYRPRQAHTSADLFGRQYPTTIEQMTLLSSENLRKKLAADNTVPSNGYNAGGRMGDAAKFCSAAAHAYSEQSQGTSVLSRVKIENMSKPLVVLNSSSSNISFVSEISEDKVAEIKQVDLEASNLLLNFFKSAGSGSSSKAQEGSTCGSSGSGSTSNQGELDGDDSVSTFSDINEADRSVSVSGRSSSTASERSEGNSDVDYSSPDDNECNLPPQILYPVEPKLDSLLDKDKTSFEEKYVCKKQKLN